MCPPNNCVGKKRKKKKSKTCQYFLQNDAVYRSVGVSLIIVLENKVEHSSTSFKMTQSIELYDAVYRSICVRLTVLENEVKHASASLKMTHSIELFVSA